MAVSKAFVDKRRQAHGVLAAFRFQLMQTLLAWIGLSPEHKLLVEHIEDFDVQSDSGTMSAQAKFSAQDKSVTLASSDTVKALCRFWDQNGHIPSVHLVYQTNLESGHERDVSFPGNAKGITYWEAVRRGASVGPLRDALVQTLPDSGLKTWLSNQPTDDDIRANLVRRVVWSVGLSSGPALSALLAEQVSGRLTALGLPLGLASVLTRQLSDRVFEVSSDSNSDVRSLDAAGLNRFLTEAALGSAASSQIWVQPSWTALTTEIDLPRLCAPRLSFLEQITTALQKGHVLWIHGASGCGKTTLARQLAGRAGLPWLLVEFRYLVEAQDILLRLARTYTDIALGTQIAGVILDDIDADLVARNPVRFGSFSDWAIARGLDLVFTSSRPCSPAASSVLRIEEGSQISAPYLELDDVREIVTNANAPAASIDAWSFFVHAAAKAGHPQLVAAKVTSLEQRAWPANALVEDIVGPASAAMELTLAEGRRRLVGDATIAGRELLKRLAAIQVKFDRAIAIRVAAIDPRIPDAASSLDFLTGPWIEPSPGQGGYLRLSPLLKGLDEDAPASEIEATRIQAAVEILRRGPMDLDRLDVVFWNSFAARSARLLLQLHQSFLVLPEDDFRAVAQQLSPLTLLPTHSPFFADDALASVTVRMMQSEISAALGRHDVFLASTTAALSEIEELHPNELREGFELILLTKALFARGTHIPWQTRLAWLETFERLAVNDPHLANEDESATLQQMRRDISPEITLAGLFLTIGAQTIQSVDDLADLFNNLEGLSRELRQSRLKQIKLFHGGYGIYVQQGWANAWFAGTLDPADALEVYGQLKIIATYWQDEDLAAECAVAQTVLLDEHLMRQEEALTLLDAELEKRPGNRILLRQRAKLLGHMDRYEEAGAILEALLETIASQSPLERLYALKEAGVAAGNTGELPKAASYFEQAAMVVSGEADPKTACHRLALLAESALCRWRAGEKSRSLTTFAAVLYSLDAIDPESSDAAFMLHERVRAAIAWIDQDDSRPMRAPFNLKIGATSALDIDMSAVERTKRGSLEEVKLLLQAVALRAGYPDTIPALDLKQTSPVLTCDLRGAELDAKLTAYDARGVAVAADALAASLVELHDHMIAIGRTDASTAIDLATSTRLIAAALEVWLCSRGEFDTIWWDRFCEEIAALHGVDLSDLTSYSQARTRTPMIRDIAGILRREIHQRRVTHQSPVEKYDFHLLCAQAVVPASSSHVLLTALTTLVRDDWAWIFDRQQHLLEGDCQVDQVEAIFEAIARVAGRENRHKISADKARKNFA